MQIFLYLTWQQAAVTTQSVTGASAASVSVSTAAPAVTTAAPGANVAPTTQQVTVAPAKPASNSSTCSSDAVSMTSEKVTTLLGTCMFAALIMSRNHLCC